MTPDTLLSLGFEEMIQALAELGLEKYRARQIREWIFQKGVFDFADMTNLPAEARRKLKARFPRILPPILGRARAKDGTTKLVLGMGDGERIECVALPDDEADSLTFCVSSQAGCPVGCVFCRTGAGGFRRQLTAEEIVVQVLALTERSGRKPTNIVFMGMGEPFLNVRNLFAAIDILTDPKGLALASRRLTVSTVGIPEAIREFAERPGEVNLALSLHAADDLTRRTMIPLAATHSLESLQAALEVYIGRTGRRVTLEMVLIAGMNDGPEHALNLVSFCQGRLYHVNLVPFNPFPGCRLLPASDAAVKEFKRALKKAGVAVTIRKSRGADILAGCGQLAAETDPGNDPAGN